MENRPMLVSVVDVLSNRSTSPSSAGLPKTTWRYVRQEFQECSCVIPMLLVNLTDLVCVHTAAAGRGAGTLVFGAECSFGPVLAKRPNPGADQHRLLL